MAVVKLFGYSCERCGYQWLPRKENPPTCPSCRNPYWNIPRAKNGKQVVEEKRLIAAVRKMAEQARLELDAHVAEHGFTEQTAAAEA
jgi:hypothetical protein